MIVLSYHKFVDQESDYRFSRTYEQFWHDFRKKKFDEIHIDDGMSCQIKACQMLTEYKIRAKLFICTSLVGQPGYCTWDELRELSKSHEICNHSHVHTDHSKMQDLEILDSICTAQQILSYEIGYLTRYFVPPYNQYNIMVDEVCKILHLKAYKGRINILNISK